MPRRWLASSCRLSTDFLGSRERDAPRCVLIIAYYMITSPLYCHETYRTVKRNTIVQFGFTGEKSFVELAQCVLLPKIYFCCPSCYVQISGEFEEERKIWEETDGSLKEINLSRWSLVVIASSRFDFCQAKESQSLFTMTSPKMNLRFWIWSRHSIVSSRFRWSLPSLKLRQNNISISDENTSWIHPINKFPLAGALENARSE